MPDLKPCPLCGGKLELSIRDDTGIFKDGYTWWEGGATCPECGVGFITGHYGGSIEVERD